jgi:hypothetical protein
MEISIENPERKMNYIHRELSYNFKKKLLLSEKKTGAIRIVLPFRPSP